MKNQQQQEVMRYYYFFRVLHGRKETRAQQHGLTTRHIDLPLSTLRHFTILPLFDQLPLLLLLLNDSVAQFVLIPATT